MTESLIVTVTAIRELHPLSQPTVRDRMIELMKDPRVKEIRFGGAIGGDTVALNAAGGWRQRRGLTTPRLIVIVPFTFGRMPRFAAEVAEQYADQIVELRRPARTEEERRKAYLYRNDIMLDGPKEAVTLYQPDFAWPKSERGASNMCLAFSDGRTGGGTAYTQRGARRRQILLEPVRVDGQPRDLGRHA